ncbi:MogA/MoaB family molybdenum cofactor biosynthesis protein [Herbidospora sp. RD11066]
MIRALVITASNRAADGVYEDRSGRILHGLLEESGCAVDGPVVVHDGEPVYEALVKGLEGTYDVIVTTGGTGLTPTDRTPEMTARVLDREIPGIAEAIRQVNREKVPTSVLSRGLSGQAGTTLVVNLPGSSGGVRDGMAVLGPILGHVVDQIRGGDHRV